jgi:hypothetical protein
MAKSKMTLREFFQKARRARKWEVVQFGEVRCEQGFCPLGAVARLRDPESRVWEFLPEPEIAAARLGLRVEYAAKIAGAADNEASPDRPWLLKNLGVRS